MLYTARGVAAATRRLHTVDPRCISFAMYRVFRLLFRDNSTDSLTNRFFCDRQDRHESAQLCERFIYGK